jgi:hypothetical protein
LTRFKCYENLGMQSSEAKKCTAFLSNYVWIYEKTLNFARLFLEMRFFRNFLRRAFSAIRALRKMSCKKLNWHKTGPKLMFSRNRNNALLTLNSSRQLLYWTSTDAAAARPVPTCDMKSDPKSVCHISVWMTWSTRLMRLHLMRAKSKNSSHFVRLESSESRCIPLGSQDVYPLS